MPEGRLEPSDLYSPKLTDYMAGLPEDEPPYDEAEIQFHKLKTKPVEDLEVGE